MVGSRWLKIDFHTHTPASSDFGRGDASVRNATPKVWIESAMRSGLDAVVVTDHNSGDFIDCLKNALHEMEVLDEKPEWYRPLIIFPGVEITVDGGGDRVHILGVFDPGCGTANIISVLALCGICANFGDADHCSSNKGLPEVLETIKQHGGISILAHVDTEKGFFYTRRVLNDSTKAILQRTVAMQVCNDLSFLSDDLRKYLEPIAVVEGSDAHNLNEIGTRFSWVKLGELTARALSFALQDKNLCIKRGSNVDPNSFPAFYIENLTIHNLKLCGRGDCEDFIAEFSPNFTSVIGGRGTGKSTLLESIRLIYRQNNITFVSNDMKERWRRFVDKMVLPTTMLTSEFIYHGTLYRLNWNPVGEKPLLEEAVEGQWQMVEPGDIQTRFHVSIYSQKQLFELANNSKGLLALVDRAINKDEWDQRWSCKKNDYLMLCMRARELRDRLKTLSGYNTRISDLDKKINEYQKRGYGEILKRYQTFGRQKRCLDVEADIAEMVVAVRVLAEKMEFHDFPVDVFEVEEGEFKSEISVIHAKLKDAISVAQKNVTQASDLIEMALGKFLNEIRDSGWEKARVKCEAEYAEKVALLRQSGDSFDPDLYGRWVAERTQLATERDRIAHLQAEQQQVLDDIKHVLSDLYEMRCELCQKRKRFMNSVLEGNKYVKMKIIPFGDMSELDSSVRSILGLDVEHFSSSLYSEDTKTGLLSRLINWESNEISSEALPNEIDILKHQIWSIVHGESSGYQVAFDKRLVSIYENQPSRINEISVYWPEDRLDVEYSVHGKFHSIEDGSPGQKSAAVLAFLLSYGTEPLVIDQPEDDLDNTLIMDLVVTQVRSNKTRRQIIIATHNPNIVVNGDAEWVCALDFRGGQIRFNSQASLDNAATRSSVCKVMEGGADALQKRYDRMIGGLSNV